MARDPASRLRTLQTGNPHRLHLLYVVPGSYELEADFHRRLKSAAGIGEWFSGPKVEEFLAFMATFSEQAIERYEKHGLLPSAPPPRKRLHRQPVSGGGYDNPRRNNWRTADGATENPVTIRYVDPASLRP